MPLPPFPPVKPTTPAEEPVRRATRESTRGSTLDKVVNPSGELRIHYDIQFRFVNFWQVATATPYWDGSTTSEELRTAVAGAPAGWLDPDDRIVQHEEGDEAKVTIDKKALNFVRVSSQKLSSRGPFWVALSGTLPAHLDETRRRGWRGPAALRDGPRRHQWGMRGSMEFYLDPFGENTHEASYKTVCVWERWKPAESKYTSGMCVLPPGTYAGFPRPMGQHESEADRLEYPAIQICAEWMTAEPAADEFDAVPATGALDRGAFYKPPTTVGWWQEGARGWRVKNPASTKATTAIFIHPGNQPNWFLGCQGPGPADRQSEWGFISKEDTRQAMWEILNAVGISQRDYVSRGAYPPAKHRKWFLIKVTAEPDAIASDGWKRKRIWL